jgi:hypothetical protein
MSKFLVLYSAPAAVIDEWMKTPAEQRKEAEEKMMRDWRNWMSDHAKLFADKGAGVGKTKRVTAQGVADTRNDVMLYAIVEAESHEAAARAFEGHPHFGIPQASIDVMPIRSLPDTERS